MAKVKRLFLSLCLGLMMVFSIIGLTACGPTVNNFNLVFKVDNESYATISTNGSEMIAIPENPSKEGYTFEGWFWDNGTWEKPFTANSLLDAPISSDMSIYAKFDTIDYIITYETNGGTHNNPASYTVEDSFALSNAEKIGYTFDGWYNGENEVSSITEGSKGDLTLTAQWTTINYTITYTNTKDVENDNIVSYTIESDTITLNPLVKAGYTFAGWYNGETEVTEIVKGSTGNIELAAKWTPIGYEITYHNIEGATHNNPTSFDVEDEPLTLVNASKLGYTFLGWYTDSSFTNQITEIAVGTVDSLDLFAKWEIIEYTATFKDGNTVVEEIKFTVETDSIADPAVPVHIGYTGKWENYTLVTENITINAVYTAIEYTATFKDGNTVVEEIKFTVEADGITEPAVPVHTGYTGEWESYTLGAESITINAVYTAIEFTATFKDGNTVVEEIKFTVETDSIAEPAVPVHVGYTGEWENYTLGLENIVINAIYNKIDYVISYHNVIGSTNPNPTGYTVENLPITLVDANKTGYTFLGWYTDAGFENQVTGIATGTTGNIDLYANWEIIEYTATFKDGGTTVDTVKFTVETSNLVEPAVPNHNGYTGEWEEYTLGLSDITINAEYTPITYDITYSDTKGVSHTNPVTYTIESETITLSNIEKDGYTFMGWYDEDVKVEQIPVGSIGDITLTAKWSIVNYTITYHNIIDATHNNTNIYTVETATIALTNASKDGYTFRGWYSDESLTNKVNSILIGTTGNLDLYAKWDTISYTATLIVDGREYDEIFFNVETGTLELPAVPNKTGYNGVWESYVIGAGNIEINAVYTAIDYKITFHFEETLGKYPTAQQNPTSYTINDEFTFIDLVNVKEGYIFDGWYTDKNVGAGSKLTSITLGTTGEINLYAQWRLKNYTINYYNVEGITNTNSKTYTVESETFNIFDVAKTGYTFDGWYSDSTFNTVANTTIEKGTTGDFNFYAKWTAIEYDITYVLYGGIYEGVSNPAKYTIEDTITFVEPVLTGYVFKGWYTEAESGNKLTGIEEGSIGNMTVYAQWTYIATMSFNANGGSTVESITQPAGTAITKPANPTKDYYTFAGWYLDSELTNEFLISYMPNRDVTLYAKWTATPYTITYINNGGTNHTETVYSYTVEDTVTIYPASKTGHTFVGWFTDELFTSVVVTEIAEGTHGDIVLYANYSINEYTISFESNGGTSVADITQNYATTVTKPQNPSQNGYTFVGWYKDSSLTTSYTFSTMPAEDITLYAKWQKVTYSITYNLDNGTNASSNPSTYTITSNTITLANPSKTGYTFVGWYEDSEYTMPITQIVNGSFGNVEIFAKWEIITYTITYHLQDDATHNNIAQYTIESDIHTLTNAELTGYTFNGWFSDSGYTNKVTTIAGGAIGDIELYAKFTANSYTVWLDGTDTASVTVTFNTNGSSSTIASQTVTESTTLKYPTKPTRTGYLFAGWYDNAECSGELFDFTVRLTTDITLYAKWIDLNGYKSINVGSSTTATLSGTTEVKYMFVPLVNGNITISTTGSVDTYGVLYDAENVILRRDDDNGTDTNFQILYNVTAGQVYYIGVCGYSASVNGSVSLIISGTTTPTAGGYVVTTNRTQATYGESFTLPLPTARDGYKFLGWIDENGTAYTDKDGNSVKAWDKAEDTILTAKWERTVYTVTFVSNGGSEVAPITLEFGARLDLNLYTTTRSGYTFSGWYLSASDTSAYNASTMPDENIILYAKWTTFALGTIKYDTDKKAVSVTDTITADLFNAICLDTDGNLATFTVAVNGTQAVGETITVRLTATSGGKTKQVTITDVKVYGMPTLTVTNTEKDYINLTDTLNDELFGASGTDTFGEATEIQVTVDGELEAGNIVTVVIASVDAAGNRTEQRLENIKVYGTPEIDVENLNVKQSVGVTVESLGATATDSFGGTHNVTIDKVVYGFVNGSEYSYYTSTTQNTKTFTALNTESYKLYYKNAYSGDRTYISVYCTTTGSTVKSQSYYTNTTYSYFNFSVTAGYEYEIRTKAYNSSYTTLFYMYLESTSAKINTSVSGDIRVLLKSTDTYGNIAEKWIDVKVYALPTISEAMKTDFKVDDTVAVESLGLTAKDSYNTALDVTLTKKSGTQVVGNTVIYTATVTDVAGNITSKDISVKFYGTPTIEVGRTDIKANESISSSTFNVSAKDSFGGSLTVSIERIDGTQTGGTYMTYKFTATDKVGNVHSVTKTIAVYDVNQINLTYMNMASDLIKLTSKGEEFFAEATDSFGNDCILSIKPYSGSLRGGITTSIYIVATDKAGNTKQSEKISNIKVYDIPTVSLTNPDKGYVIAEGDNIDFLFTVYDSFGEELATEILPKEDVVAGKIIEIVVRATDIAGNEVDEIYSFGVVNEEYPSYIELFVNNDVWKTVILEEGSVNLPVVEINNKYFYAWVDENGNPVTDEDGRLVVQITKPYIKLYAEFYDTIESLSALKNISSTGKYILLNDIDLDSAEWSSLSDFSGVFNGNYHTVSNFKITKIINTYPNETGLFQVNNGIIKNLGITNFNISVSSNTYTGGLVGENNGQVINCYAIGTIKANENGAAAIAGGLVGSNTGTIINSYATVTITSSVSGSSGCPAYSGGLVGYNNGHILQCYSSGTVSASFYVASISQTHANHAYAGGLVAANNGTIIDSYSSATVSAQSTTSDSSMTNYVYSYAGGLVGYNGGTIGNSFAVGNVESKASGSYSYAGGLVGNNANGVYNCYRASVQTIKNTMGSTTNTVGSNTQGTSTTSANLMSASWIKNNLWAKENTSWSFKTGAYPLLYWQENLEIQFTVYTISSKADLIKLQGQTLKMQYRLMCDIDLNGMDWKPINLLGIFDGNGYTIKNFTMTTSYANNGFFDYNGGIIKDLNLSDVTVQITRSGSNYAKEVKISCGILTAINRGSIVNCSVQGSINIKATNSYQAAKSYAGGLVCENYGNIIQCSANTNITATTKGSYSGTVVHAGGLVADNYGEIADCYTLGLIQITEKTDSSFSGGIVAVNSGIVKSSYSLLEITAPISGSGSNYAGGLVGSSGGKLIDCYATGNITITTTYTSGKIYAGGIAGSSYGGEINNCYYSSEQNVILKKGSTETTPVIFGNERSLAEIQTIAFHIETLSWNDEIWNISNGSYPTLK